MCYLDSIVADNRITKKDMRTIIKLIHELSLKGEHLEAKALFDKLIDGDY